MNIIKYIILGIIQGFTEPLPISSSGHLLLFKNLFETNIFYSLNFEIISNFGSFLAILMIYFTDIVKIIKQCILYILKKNRTESYKSGFKYAVCIIISTIPAGICGILFKNKIENFHNVFYLAFAFLITSLGLFIIKNKDGKKNDYQINFKDALIIGLFQAISIIPGISRSGAVLTACMLCNLKRSSSLKYTFLLYFPISIAALLLGINDFLSTPNLNDMIIPYFSGLIAAFLITYISYNWLSKIVTTGKLIYFSIYCLLLSTWIIIYFH